MIDLGKFFDEAFLYGEENYKDFLFTSIFDNYFRNKIGDKKRHDEYLACLIGPTILRHVAMS